MTNDLTQQPTEKTLEEKLQDALEEARNNDLIPHPFCWDLKNYGWGSQKAEKLSKQLGIVIKPKLDEILADIYRRGQPKALTFAQENSTIGNPCNTKVSLTFEQDCASGIERLTGQVTSSLITDEERKALLRESYRNGYLAQLKTAEEAMNRFSYDPENIWCYVGDQFKKSGFANAIGKAEEYAKEINEDISERVRQMCDKASEKVEQIVLETGKQASEKGDIALLETVFDKWHYQLNWGYSYDKPFDEPRNLDAIKILDARCFEVAKDSPLRNLVRRITKAIQYNYSEIIRLREDTNLRERILQLDNRLDDDKRLEKYMRVIVQKYGLTPIAN